MSLGEFLSVAAAAFGVMIIVVMAALPLLDEPAGRAKPPSP